MKGLVLRPWAYDKLGWTKGLWRNRLIDEKEKEMIVNTQLKVQVIKVNCYREKEEDIIKSLLCLQQLSIR